MSATPMVTERTCRLCGEKVQGDQGRARSGAFDCRGCLTLTSLVHRNLGMDMLASFSPEERTHFFKKSKTSAEGSGRYKWPTVRAVIIERKTSQTLTESENNVFTESKPGKPLGTRRNNSPNAQAGCALCWARLSKRLSTKSSQRGRW